MVIVLRKRQEGKRMAEHENTQTGPVPEQAHEAGHRGATASQVAAAVEAAYILEAVRK